MENFASARFLLPIMVVFIVVILIPFLQSLVFSFTDYSGYNFADAKFVGFANYVQCFKDPTLLAGLGFTLLYTVATTVLITVIALPLAVVLNRKFFGRNFARSLFFFFSVPSMAVLGLVWQYIFSPLKSGVVNTLLAKIGIDAIPWLSNSELAKFCVIFVAVWAQIGWHATLYLAYLQAIPADIYEQAAVDGANRRQQFFNITLPQMVPAMGVSIFMLLTGGLKVYDLPYGLTSGGPGYSTYTVTQSIIHTARFEPGSGTGLRTGRHLLHLLRAVGRPAAGNHQSGRKEAVMTLQQRERIGSIIRSVVVIAIALICAVPLYVIVINTFKSSAEMSMDPIGLPKTWNFENYTYAFGHLPIVNAFKNTIIVTVVGVGLQVLFGALAAYGMILKKSKFTAVIGVLLMLSFIIPGQTLLIPQYRMEAQVGLVDSLLGLIVLYTGGATFCYFLIVQYMRGLPYEIIEAARIDGAGPFRIFWTIVLPLIRPILTTVIVFQTMGTWNDFMTPSVYISSTNKQTIVLQVFNAISTFTTNWPLFMTVTTIALIPVFVFFIFCQRWIVAGLVAGSVKG